MSAMDFAPFYRSAIGFDRVVDILQDALRAAPADNYPPYNIEKTDENAYRITLAVAGFAESDISITAQPNRLIVVGRRPSHNGAAKDGQPKEGVQFLHQGIAQRGFERRFDLADHVEVTGASLENGLLVIELKRVVPEAMKPRTIQIGTKPAPKEIEQQAA